MINLTSMDRQHDSIKTELNLLDEEIKKGSNGMDLAKVALHISKLAGLLKIHLLEEDRFLYPDLYKSDNKEINDLAHSYNKEMGSLAEEYTNFKNKYNVASKIKGNEEVFLVEARKVVADLNNRMLKEDTQLYRMIKEKNL